MGDDYEQRAGTLAAQLLKLQAKFIYLRSAQSHDQLNLQYDLATKTTSALAALKKLAQLIGGDFNPGNPPSEIKTTLKDLDSSWQETDKASEKYLDSINSYSINVVQFHDVDLGDWQRQATALQTDLQAAQKSTEQACDVERMTLQALYQARQAAEGSVNTLRQKLYDAQHKYDEADKWSWIFSLARGVLEPLKPIIKAISHDFENANNAVQTATNQANDAEACVREQEAKVQNLNDLAATQANLLPQGSSLLSECGNILGGVEQTEKEIARIKTSRFNAWQFAGKCPNRAELADFALLKSDYASSILMVVNVALDDYTLTVKTGICP